MNKTLLAVILSLIAGFAGFAGFAVGALPGLPGSPLARWPPLARNRAATDLPMALI
jgi:hypothetical protein